MKLNSYVISLKKPICLINQLKSMGFDNVVLIKGINGSLLTKDEIKNVTSSEILSNIIPKSIIGCFLAHLKAWENFLTESDNELGLFFEDDVTFTKDFKIRLDEAIENLPQHYEYDYLSLGYFGEWKFGKDYINKLALKTTLTLHSEEHINLYWKKPTIALGTHAYILTRNGAEKLYKHLKNNISDHIDVCINQLHLDNIINILVLRNRIAFQTSTLGLNINGTHPLSLSIITSNFYIDKSMSLSYILNLVLIELSIFKINLMSILFFILGIIFCTVNPVILLMIFLSVSFVDIISIDENIRQIIFHMILFLLPSIIMNFLR